MKTWHGWLLIIAFSAAYCAPAISASLRRHSQTKSIWRLNLILGWTVVGWIFALLWALTAEPARPLNPQLTPGPHFRECPECKWLEQQLSLFCSRCGCRLDQPNRQ